MLILTLVVILQPEAKAAIVTDVGTLERPIQNPRGGISWTLSSECVDINDVGQAACQSIALGPVYRYGFRNAQKGRTEVSSVAMFDGFTLTSKTGSSTSIDRPKGINESGDIYGYVYSGQVYYMGAGRIWGADGTTKVKSDPVLWVNDLGQYVTEGRGIFSYYSGAYNSDGTLIDVAGFYSSIYMPTQPGTYPQLISNNGSIGGIQQIQQMTADSPDITGSGWFLTQAEVDVLPVVDGVFDDLRWFDLYSSAAKIYSQYDVRRTQVLDSNNNGDIVISTINSFQYPTGSMICGRSVDDVCDYQYSPEGIRQFVGINDNRDAVGTLFTNSTIASGKLTVWLNDGEGLVANDLNTLIAGSGYTATAVGDINNSRQIAATCKKSTGEVRGCVISL